MRIEKCIKNVLYTIIDTRECLYLVTVFAGKYH